MTTFNLLANAVGQPLDAVTSAECANYFVNAGYEPA